MDEGYKVYIENQMDDILNQIKELNEKIGELACRYVAWQMLLVNERKN